MKSIYLEVLFYLSFPIITYIVHSQNKQNIFNTFFLFLLISLFCFVIIITGERSSFVKLLLVIFFSIIFLTSLLGTLRNKIIIFLTFLLGILLIVTYQPKLKERIIYHTFDLLLQKKFENKIDRNLSIFQNLIVEYQQGNLKPVYFSKEHNDHAKFQFKCLKIDF